MEMNSDLIAIQGLLSSVVKTTGDFTKIKYKGGNEMKINRVIKELEDYLTSRQYIKERLSNKIYYKELNDITFFLTLNLDFKDATIMDIKEFTHLIKVIPTLSVCLLANIITELDLNEYYCNALHKLPAELSEELLCEIIPCIKKSNAETSLDLTYLYMKNIIKKISSIDTTNYKMTECIDKLEEISSQILLNCSGINLDQTRDWKKLHIYNHMGKTLLILLKLLQHCQVDNEVLFKVIDDLINSICTVMQAVTVDVFCAWAEVQCNNEPLQTIIAEQAYHIIEKFQKHEPARPLIQMLGSIARKPKSVNELILEANSSTMISKIEQNSTDRQKWFTALLTTQVFQSDQAKECISRWANLCTIEDLARLLNLSINHRDEEDVILIIMKCASFFTETELAIMITRFFYLHGLKNCLKSKNTLQQLTITLNKLEKNVNREPIKDVLLLFLQDPETVLTTLYKESIKNNMLLDCLKETFICISEAVTVEKLFLRILEKILEECKPDLNNIRNYEKLFKVIAETHYKKLIHSFLLPHIEQYLTDANYDDLNYVFIIYKEIINKASAEELDKLIQVSINILEKCRWKIFDFTKIKAVLCEEVVQILLDAKSINYRNITEENILSLKHMVNKYYIQQLKDQLEFDFLDFMCPHLNTDNHAESVAYLIKLLPLCVQKEWIIIANGLLKKCEINKLLEIITDALIIISQVVQTQSENENTCLLNGLKFCIQNYGLILKDIVIPLQDEEINIILIKSVCRLLRDMPDGIFNIEGMSLISLLPNKTLKELTQDDSFLSILLSMNGSQSSRIIAQKMLE